MDKIKYYDATVSHLGDWIEDARVTRRVLKAAIDFACDDDNVNHADVMDMLAHWANGVPEELTYTEDAAAWWRDNPDAATVINLHEWCRANPAAAASLIIGEESGAAAAALWAYNTIAHALCWELQFMADE